MMNDTALDERIRSAIGELIDLAPPAPQLQLEIVDLGTRRHFKSFRPIMVPVVTVAMATVIVLGLIVIPGGNGPRVVSEKQLGMRLVSDAPVGAGPIPDEYVAVANGTFFGNPWILSSVNPDGGRLCVAFTYLGSVIDNACGPAGHKISNPPAWAVSSVMTSLDTASDGQRYLTAVTNGVVTKLTVSAQGTTVTADALPTRLGNASFFVVSLGREQGPCDGLCEGSVTLSFSGPSGNILVGNAPSMVDHDRGGDYDYINAPVRAGD